MNSESGWQTKLPKPLVTCLDFFVNIFYKHRALFILAFASLSIIIIGGKRRCFSVLLGKLHEDFNGTTTKLELNWIGNSYAALGFFCMPLAASLILAADRCYSAASFAAAVTIFISCLLSSFVPSPSWLFLTHTLIHGIGSTLAMTAGALIVGDYFDEKHRFHVLATTLVSGGPFGAIIFCPLFGYWVREEGWRATFRNMGAIFLVVMTVAALVYTPKKDEYDDLEKTAEGAVTKKRNFRSYFAFVSFKNIKDNPQIVIWLVQRIVHNIIMYSIAMNLYDYMQDAMTMAGYSTEIAEINASKIQLLYAVGESLVFVLGLVGGDRIRGKLPIVYLVGAAVLTVLMLFWYFLQEIFSVQFFLALFVGAAIGTGNTMLYATSEEVMKVSGSISFPFTKVGAGVGMLLAPQFSGLVIDKMNGKFHGFFLVQAALSSCSMFLLIAIYGAMCMNGDDADESLEPPQPPGNASYTNELSYGEHEQIVQGASGRSTPNRDLKTSSSRESFLSK